MSISERERVAAAAIIQDSINNPPTQITSRPTIYNVSQGTGPSWIKFDTINRMGVKFNTGHTEGLGTNPIEIKFKFRMYGAPTNGLIRVGIRKASDDFFVLIAEHPVEFNPAFVGAEHTAIIMGANPYSLVAGDLVTLEFPANATSGIELPVSTAEAFPTNTLSQQYVSSSWANTTSNRPLAINIRALKQVPI